MNPAQLILFGLVQIYRWTLSPAKTFLFGPSAGCRFTPGCSEYAQQAVRKHGAARGSWLAAKRVCRCHPWGGCGHDPVPEMELGTQGSGLFRSFNATGKAPGRGSACRAVESLTDSSRPKVVGRVPSIELISNSHGS